VNQPLEAKRLGCTKHRLLIDAPIEEAHDRSAAALVWEFVRSNRREPPQQQRFFDGSKGQGQAPEKLVAGH
jgi:hypothetical protein